MNNHQNCQLSSNDGWAAFAAELADLQQPVPITLAMQLVFDDLDAIMTETDPLADMEAELDCVIAASEGLAVPAMPASMPARSKTFLDHWKDGFKIASKSPSANPLQTPADRALEYVRAQGCPVAASTPPSTPLLTPSQGTTRSPSRAASGKTWERASAADKFDHAMHTAQAHHGFALTLNLSPAREKAIAGSADPARAMSRHLQRAFADLGLTAPDFAFILEIAPAGRVHVHGAVIPHGLDLDLLKRALMRAGGKLAGRAASRQVKLTRIDNASGWSGYLRKDTGRTRRTLGLDKITFICANLRSLTRSHW